MYLHIFVAWAPTIVNSAPTLYRMKHSLYSVYFLCKSCGFVNTRTKKGCYEYKFEPNIAFEHLVVLVHTCCITVTDRGGQWGRESRDVHIF
jgi:hypothetical protein